MLVTVTDLDENVYVHFNKWLLSTQAGLPDLTDLYFQKNSIMLIFVLITNSLRINSKLR